MPRTSRTGIPLPSEEVEASGSPPAVLQRLDSLIDLAVALWSPADAETLAVRARWAGFPVTLGFRTHRWAAHLEEHTLQVDKTIAMLGTPIAETHRLHRLLCRAWGDVEAVVFALRADEASRAAADEVAGRSIRVAAEGALALVRRCRRAPPGKRSGRRRRAIQPGTRPGAAGRTFVPRRRTSRAATLTGP